MYETVFHTINRIKSSKSRGRVNQLDKQKIIMLCNVTYGGALIIVYSLHKLSNCRTVIVSVEWDMCCKWFAIVCRPTSG